MQMPGEMGPVHILGIGGIGMSAIAEILHAKGYTVQGSDQKDSANVRRLRAKGIRVFVGHDPVNLVGARYIVISTAVKPSNPELEAARAKGLPIIRRAEMLAELMRLYATVSVTGTHGKTTTTSLIAHIFNVAGLDPTVITGGIINEWGSNARLGDGKWMIVEADESDGTFIKMPDARSASSPTSTRSISTTSRRSRTCTASSRRSFATFPSTASPSPASTIPWSPR